ncbi:MAG: hypothetical protein CL678_06870 [Bdellovibrionaceae bacterium]|nr:hypothetical protein [Pseudobdellovibrionaceae bacterium]|tara:strand:+ start:169 stop:1968 length:1800 start_codon:yes stop_codon:yes gene_type:complete
MKTSLIPLIISLCIVGTILSSCEKKTNSLSQKTYYGVIRDNAKTLDPALAYDEVSSTITPQIYEPLFQYAYLKDPLSVEPNLAADFPIYSKDRLTVTIRMKQGIHFHDSSCFAETNGKGREATVHDIIYQLKRLADPRVKSNGWWILDGKIKGINDFHKALVQAKPEQRDELFKKPVSGLKAIDNYTLQINLTQPYPHLLYVLSMTFTAPVPHEAIESFGNENGVLTEKQIGTGPFILSRWSHGNEIILDKNPNYHTDFYPTEASETLKKKGLLKDAGKVLPLIDQAIFKVIKEDQPTWLQFEKGNLDFIKVPKDQYGIVLDQNKKESQLKEQGVTLHKAPGTVFYYVVFNNQDRVVGGNKYIRQALSSAINRERLNELFEGGHATVMNSPLPPSLSGYSPKEKLKFNFNLKKAKKLLEKAGFPEGKDLPTLKMDMRQADSRARQMGEFFVKSFKKIGVNVTIVYNTFPSFLEKIRNGNYQMALGGWSLDYPDAQNVFQLLYGKNQAPGPNESNFNHPLFNRAYLKMAQLPEGKERSALIAQMNQIIQEEVPWAMLYVRNTYSVTNPWLKNKRESDLILNFLKYIRIDPKIKRRYRSTR